MVKHNLIHHRRCLGVDKKIILWDIPEARPAAEFAGHTDTVHSLRFSRDGHILASGLYILLDTHAQLFKVPHENFDLIHPA